MKGIVSFHEARCKGCGLCISVCLRDVLALNQDKTNAAGYHPSSTRAPERCIACGNCARICPDGVITVEKEVDAP